MTVELANRLIDFFEQPGKCQATLVGGESRDWRNSPDLEWQAFYNQFGKVVLPKILNLL